MGESRTLKKMGKRWKYILTAHTAILHILRMKQGQELPFIQALRDEQELAEESVNEESAKPSK